MLQILLLFIPSIDFLPETNNPVLLYNSPNINIINSELSDFPKNLRSLPEKKSVEKATESVLISSINLSVMNDYIFERKKHY